MRIVVLFAAVALAAGCARSREEKFIDHWDAMTAVLATVTDEESAHAAVDDLLELEKKSKQLRLNPDGTSAEMQKKIDEALARFQKEFKRILRKPKLAKIIAPALPQKRR